MDDLNVTVINSVSGLLAWMNSIDNRLTALEAENHAMRNRLDSFCDTMTDFRMSVNRLETAARPAASDAAGEYPVCTCGHSQVTHARRSGFCCGLIGSNPCGCQSFTSASASAPERITIERDDFLGIALHVIAAEWASHDQLMHRGTCDRLSEGFFELIPDDIRSEEMDAVLRRFAAATVSP